MKLNEIRTFVTVAEAQSVQEAGLRLGLTQSAVSRLIQRLEGELGVVLFDRQTKPLALTRDGELALAHARRVLAATSDLSEAFDRGTEPRGLLRLGVAHVLTLVTAAEPLDGLRSAFPNLTVRFHSDWSTPLMEQVRHGGLDGAVVLLSEEQTPPEDLDGRCLSHEDVMVMTPERFRGRAMTLAEMNEIGWVLQPEGCRYRSCVTQALARIGQAPNILVEAFDQTLLASLVARGVGFGLAPPRLIARAAGGAGQLSLVTLPGLSLTVTVWLVRARCTARLAAVFDRLEKSLAAELSQPIPWPRTPAEPVFYSAAE